MNANEALQRADLFLAEEWRLVHTTLFAREDGDYEVQEAREILDTLAAEVRRLRQGIHALRMNNPNRDPASESCCHCDCCYGWDTALAALEHSDDGT